MTHEQLCRLTLCEINVYQVNDLLDTVYNIHYYSNQFNRLLCTHNCRLFMPKNEDLEFLTFQLTTLRTYYQFLRNVPDNFQHNFNFATVAELRTEVTNQSTKYLFTLIHHYAMVNQITFQEAFRLLIN